MIIRILVCLGLAVFCAGFIWFSAMVIYLGLKDFFSIYLAKKPEENTNGSIENDEAVPRRQKKK